MRIVIIGAGHAGGTLAALLRQYGFDGAITLVGAETVAPYQRPPLSKAWLKGEADAQSLLLKTPGFYAHAGIEMLLGRRAARIDRARQAVVLEDGSELDYDRLTIATGATPRRLALPGIDLSQVLELRTTVDADRLKTAVDGKAALAVIGGGYIGLEVAAVARALGAEVVVIEREARLLARVACPELSSFFLDYHGARGVRFEFEAQVDAIEAAEGAVSGVRLADGRLVPAQAVLVGVGAVPEERIAREADLACDGGILVDLEARTSDPSIFAIGDVTRRPLPLYGRQFRLESVPNALEQAKQVACAITGRSAPAPEVPWFWSDQYDLKLQIAGLPFDVVRRIVRGDLAAARFAVFHLDAGDRVQAVEAVNAPTEFMAGRMLIGNRRPVSAERLADGKVPMKEVAL